MTSFKENASVRLARAASVLLASGALAAAGACSLPPYGAVHLPTPGLGASWQSPRDGMAMVSVPAGKFLMGSAVGLSDEQPVHSVDLDAFWIDKTEVTNSQYGQCVAGGSCTPPSDPTYYNDAAFSNHPVVYVSWNDARAYCAWAERRLPTEAEWEKAATWDPLTGQSRTYPWGNAYNCKQGNFDDEDQLDSFEMPGGTNCDGFVRSAPVGSFPAGASPYGALDMAGNVWEWVHDAFIETDPLVGSTQNYYAISPPSNPQGVDPTRTEYRVMRGGSWSVDFGFARSAYRLWFGLDENYDGVGFRCARSP